MISIAKALLKGNGNIFTSSSLPGRETSTELLAFYLPVRHLSSLPLGYRSVIGILYVSVFCLFQVVGKENLPPLEEAVMYVNPSLIGKEVGRV